MKYIKGDRVMDITHGTEGTIIGFVNGEPKVRWEYGRISVCSRSQLVHIIHHNVTKP